ncbi:threonine/serine dehydratase [Salininema proteolyticum]|uniref:Threonine/serine dehydratase n=1 Tax=Salininema proteolyticum TaxID=1607685 RepID=A0ABV8U303_9ACTN
MITYADITTAAHRTTRHLRTTPLTQIDHHLWLKHEYLQHTGTFKARGAANRLAAAARQGHLDPHTGVVTASGGNAGLATAWAARTHNVPATVFVPTTAPTVKLTKLAALGARVQQVGDIYADAYEAAIDHHKTTGALFNHAYDQKEICAGAGTLALETITAQPHLDTIIVACGGGGLMAGVATAAAQHGITTIAAEPENAATLTTALANGQPTTITPTGIAADSLGASRIGDIAYHTAREHNVQTITVTDEAITNARHQLWQQHRIVVEHGAATAWAALTTGAYQPQEHENTAVVLCGANTDPTDLNT